jgi:transcriptional regulator with XRE-family HTH domain
VLKNSQGIDIKDMDKTIFSEGHKALVKKLIKAREEMKLRQEDVARLLGRTQSYISKIEAGQRRIDIIQLKEFAKIYKKSLNFFIK